MKRAKPVILSLMVSALVISVASDTEAACTGASPTWTSTPDRASVSACIERATPGDRISITAGTADWSGGGVGLDKALTIIGAGNGCPASCDNATTLRVGTATAFAVTASSWRISGITFEGPGSGSGSIAINAGGSSSATQWRVDHCHFKDTTGRGITVGQSASERGYAKDFPGLIDGNRFSAASRFKAVQTYGGSLTPHGTWDEPLQLGGPSWIFIEDNYFVHSSMPDGVSSIDGDSGARFVIRYNTFINADITAHGIEGTHPTGSNPQMWRSTHGWEIYGNTFSHSNYHTFTLNIRGGTGVIFGNSYSGTPSLFPTVRYMYERGDYARSCGDAGSCQGNNPYDGNEPGRYGYPCYTQIGVTGSNGITKMPAYQWGSTYYESTDEYGNTGVTFDAVCTYQHVQRGRDYIAAFSGPIARRPSSCSLDQAYWATDEADWNANVAGPDGRLYKCTSTNAWTLYYTPFPYPHPAQAGGPAAPTNLRIVR